MTEECDIVAYFHCRECLKSKPAEVTPAEWQRISVGINQQGDLRVWCERHDRSVALITETKILGVADILMKPGIPPPDEGNSN